MLSIPTAIDGKTRDYNSLKAVMLVAVLIVAAISTIGIINSELSDAADPKINLDPDKITLNTNGFGYVDVTIDNYEEGYELTATSSNTIVTISPSSIKSKESTFTVESSDKKGTSTITFKLLDKDGKQVGSTATFPVTVKEFVKEVSIIDSTTKKPITGNVNIDTGGEKKVEAKINPSGAIQTVTWSTSDSSIATVTDGLIKGVKKGTATITATSTDDTTKKNSITVVVSDVDVKSVTLKADKSSVYIHDQVTLTATILPENATDKTITVSWEPSSMLKKVSQTIKDNVITIKMEATGDVSGDVVITVKTTNQSKTDSVTIKVERVAVKGVELNDDAEELEVDEVYDELKAKIDPTNATNQKITWTSSNTSVATVDENGHVKAVSPGTAIITVKTDEGGFTDSCEITVLKTFTIMGTIDSTGNVLNPETLVKTINETAAKGLYPSFSVLAVLSESVSMSSDIIQALQKANGGEMAIATINGSIYFDENAIDNIDASGKTAGITFTDIPPETYPKFGECYVYEISMTKDGEKHPTSFGATGPKIAIPHELAEGEDAAKLKVALVYGDGNALMLRNYSFVTDEDEETAVVFEPPHMSTFMYMFHDSEYISTDSFDIVFVALLLVLVLALGGGVAFLEFHPVASEKFMNLFDNPNKPPKKPRFPGRSRKNEYDDYYNNDYYR